MVGLIAAVLVIAMLARQQLAASKPGNLPPAAGTTAHQPASNATPSSVQAKAVAIEVERQADQAKARLEAAEAAGK
ncbi:hypothetical protein IP84_01735 [beta proteobacterium AAP99]|nr:hypothetical protein IP84_01735 [beta proteobacterium AAP99]